MNLVMNSAGEFIELQGTGEEATFTDTQLADLLALGKRPASANCSPRSKPPSPKVDSWLPKNSGAKKLRRPPRGCCSSATAKSRRATKAFSAAALT
jgi:hypothetical protein